MNKVQNAVYELNEMDELAAGSSPVHKLHPAAKLISTIVYIVTVISFNEYDLDRLVPMLIYPVILFQLSGIAVSSCFHKLRFALPLVIAVGVFNPLLDRRAVLKIGAFTVTAGMISMLTLMLKGIFCLMASFLLMATTSIDSLCAALRAFHVPGILVTLLLLTYRYAGLMAEELAVMTDAYHLRAPGQKGIHVSAWGSFLGQLLLRSMDRAQELYSSMMLRGYKHQFHYAEAAAFGITDAVYMFISVAITVLLRFIDIASFIGGYFVR